LQNSLTNEEILIYRAMQPFEKLVLVDRFYRDARSLKRAALKSFHPEWKESEIDKKLAELFLYAAD
jgi:hypothetical protein